MRRPENAAKITGLRIVKFPGNAVYGMNGIAQQLSRFLHFFLAHPGFKINTLTFLKKTAEIVGA